MTGCESRRTSSSGSTTRTGSRWAACRNSGWRNVRNGPQQVTYASGGRTLTVAYRLSGDRAEASVQAGDAASGSAAPDNPEDLAAGHAVRLSALLYACLPDLVDLQVDGVRRRHVQGNEGAAALAIGSQTLLIIAHHVRAALGAHRNRVLGILEFLGAEVPLA